MSQDTMDAERDGAAAERARILKALRAWREQYEAPTPGPIDTNALCRRCVDTAIGLVSDGPQDPVIEVLDAREDLRKDREAVAVFYDFLITTREFELAVRLRNLLGYVPAKKTEADVR